MSMLKQEYKEQDVDLRAGLELAIKVLSKTLDTNKLTPEKSKPNQSIKNVVELPRVNASDFQGILSSTCFIRPYRKTFLSENISN